MGEVGCLKDGAFQNSEVNKNLIAPSEFNIDFRGDDIAVAGTTYGAGVVGTLSGSRVPELRRWTENGIIITQLKVDITGLSAQGDKAHDVIGLATGGPAFIYKNVVADNGSIFKITVACIEAPGQETATITSDIDFAFNASAVLAYNGDASSSQLDMGTSVAGISKELLAAPAADYMYITEGGSAADTGLYNAGQYIITFYGQVLP